MNGVVSFLAMTLMLFCCATAGAIPVSERAALIQLYSDTDGPNWDDRSGWLGPSGSECGWKGITCDQDHVVELKLGFNNLVGEISAINSLTNLRVLDLQYNSIKAIPSLSALAQLRVVNLQNCGMGGQIPPLQGLVFLQQFEINSNFLEGSIPSLAGLNALNHFSVWGNHLAGPIPPIAGLNNLGYFAVNDNALSGTIPELTGLLNLWYFDVSTNKLV